MTCEYCEESPATLRILVTDTAGNVLDSAHGCAACLRADLASLGLHPGATATHDSARRPAAEARGNCQECGQPIGAPSTVDCLSHAGAAWQAIKDGRS
jgi:hypothetical protein